MCIKSRVISCIKLLPGNNVCLFVLNSGDNTNLRNRAGFSSSVSGNLKFGLRPSDQKGLDIGRADWNEMSNRGSAGSKSIGFGFDAHSSGIPTKTHSRKFKINYLFKNKLFKYLTFN